MDFPTRRNGARETPQLECVNGPQEPASVNPLSPHDALKHHFTSLKTDLIF